MEHPALSAFKKNSTYKGSAEDSRFKTDKDGPKQKKRILVIDDDETILFLIRDILEWGGYDVDLAASGAEGLLRFHRFQPDLILLDIEMPGMDGYEVCSRLKKQDLDDLWHRGSSKIRKSISPIPVVFLTMHATADHVQEAAQVGADGYIVKRFNPREFLARIAQFFKSHETLSEAEIASTFKNIGPGHLADPKEKQIPLEPRPASALSPTVATAEQPRPARPHRGSGLVDPSFSEFSSPELKEGAAGHSPLSAETAQEIGGGIIQAFKELESPEQDNIDVDTEYEKLMDAARSGQGEPVTDKLREMTHRFGPKLMGLMGFQAVPGKCYVRVLDDGLRVELDICPPSSTAEAVTVEKIRQLLERNRVIYGVDDAAVAMALETGKVQRVRGACIAWGIPALAGNDGRIELVQQAESEQNDQGFVRIEKNPELATLFPDVNIQTVEKGQKIATLIQPTRGKPGKNVYGKDIPAETGRPLAPKVGDHVAFDSRRGEFYSKISGRVVLEGNYINVENFLLIGKDLDTALGHVKFPGELAVRGWVHRGLLVETKKDILIEGGVEAAQVFTTDGSILIREGVQGGGSAFLSAKWDVTSGFIEQATVMAGGIIRTSTATGSELAAGEAVRVTDGRGEVVGCRIYAGNLVEVNALGTGRGDSTSVYLGRTPEELLTLSRIRRRMQTLQKAIVDAEAELKRSMSASEYPSPGAMTEESQRIMALAKRILILNSRFHKSRDEEKQLDQLMEQRTGGRLDVRGRVYPGVKIYIGGAPYPVKKTLSWVRFQYDLKQKRIVAVPLN